MEYGAEDRLKSFLSLEIDRLNPGLYERDPQKYFRLCKQAYEQEKYGGIAHIKKDEP